MAEPDTSPPAGSTARVERVDGSLRILFPALGVLRSPGSLLFVIFGAMIAVTAFQMVRASEKDPSYGTMGIVAFLLAAALVVLGVAVGRREVQLERTGDELVVSSRGLVGGWSRRWKWDAVEAIAAVESGWTQGGRGNRRADVYQLRVTFREGKPLTLLSGRTREELAWVAAALTSGPESS